MVRKYKVGDKVRVKSLYWYNNNRNNESETIHKGVTFVYGMSKFCGKVVTIKRIGDFVRDEYGCCIYIKEDFDSYSWQAYMFEEINQLELDFG